MAKKKATRKKTAATKSAQPQDTLKAALDDIRDELHELWHIENVADNIGALFTPLDALSDAVTLSVIAQYGSNDDRERIVEILKRRFEEFG